MAKLIRVRAYYNQTLRNSPLEIIITYDLSWLSPLKLQNCRSKMSEPIASFCGKYERKKLLKWHAFYWYLAQFEITNTILIIIPSKLVSCNSIYPLIVALWPLLRSFSAKITSGISSFSSAHLQSSVLGAKPCLKKQQYCVHWSIWGSQSPLQSIRIIIIKAPILLKNLKTPLNFRDHFIIIHFDFVVSFLLSNNSIVEYIVWFYKT